MNIETSLSELKVSGNLRSIPTDVPDGIVDFTSNDYLGFGADTALRERFFEKHSLHDLAMTSSASRLLAGAQKAYSSLEQCISASYDHGRQALLFNSGYHANTGIIPAVADKSTIILADRLVHASIIDGIRLSGGCLYRFQHNDFDRLENLISKSYPDKEILVIVESIYSMDGDRADLQRLAELKKHYPNIILYVDEAHAIGVSGPGGLGEVIAADVLHHVDILIGTFGKALASAGAFALVSPMMYQYLVNKCRSLIFSTALPPAQILWTEFVWRHSLNAESAREKLSLNARILAEIIPGAAPSHIRPLIIGDSIRAVELSHLLMKKGFNVLPIRTPTVPAGTERLRFSLSSAIGPDDISRLGHALKEFIV